MKNVKKKIAACLLVLGLGVVTTSSLMIDPPWIFSANVSTHSVTHRLMIDPPWIF